MEGNSPDLRVVVGGDTDLSAVNCFSSRAINVGSTVPEVCPECHSADTTTIASTSGVYCRCSHCDHVHKDRVVLHWRSPHAEQGREKRTAGRSAI